MHKELLLLLLLLLSHFSHVRLCATPLMAAHQVLPSLGFSRQEHWSVLLCRACSRVQGLQQVWHTGSVVVTHGPSVQAQ